jgi:hypothetical protein
MQIKVLDISQKGGYPSLNSTLFSHPVIFQPEPNLLEMAMRARRSKGLKVEPPRDFGSSLEAFSFGR